METINYINDVIGFLNIFVLRFCYSHVFLIRVLNQLKPKKICPNKVGKHFLHLRKYQNYVSESYYYIISICYIGGVLNYV